MEPLPWKGFFPKELGRVTGPGQEPGALLQAGCEHIVDPLLDLTLLLEHLEDLITMCQYSQMALAFLHKIIFYIF